MAETTPALSVRTLAVSYGRERVLHDVSFEVQSGRIVGVFGPNGAGKSTLLKAALGVLRPDQGQVLAFGRPLREARARIVYVPQRSAVDWDFPVTVADVVLMGRYGKLGLFGRPGREDRRIADEAMERLGITDLRDRQIAELSGGQQQRTFLARALAQQGDLLLMDEPFVGVDARTERTIIDLIRDLRDRGKAALIINHDLQTAHEYFDDILLLNRTTVAFGPVADTFTAEHLSRCYGGRLAILDGGRALIAR